MAVRQDSERSRDAVLAPAAECDGGPLQGLLALLCGWFVKPFYGERNLKRGSADAINYSLSAARARSGDLPLLSLSFEVLLQQPADLGCVQV